MPKQPRGQRVRFGWDLEYFLERGVSSLVMTPDVEETDEENEQKMLQALHRYNQHQISKEQTSAQLAAEISESIKANSAARTKPSEQQPIQLTMMEQNRGPETAITTEALVIGRRHVRRSAADAQALASEGGDGTDADGKPRNAVLTNAKPISSLMLINDERSRRREQEKKRLVTELESQGADASSPPPSNPPAKRMMTMNSFSAIGATQLEDLVNENTKYWRRNKNPGDGLKLFRREVVSSRHIAKVLFEAFDQRRQAPCANAISGFCRSLRDPALQHPCKPGAVCMRYLSPLQWQAYELGEEVPVIGSPGDRFFLDPLCVFCYRYQLTQEVSQDGVAGSSSINTEIASYYHQVDIIGEYDKSACIQEHNGNVSGILGPVVAYNTAAFRPIVGILREGTWQMERILTVEEYELEKETLTNCTIVMGWAETEAVLMQVNNNTVPSTAQLSPYENRITRIKDGPVSLRLLLERYFRHHSKHSTLSTEMAYEHLFMEFRDVVTQLDALCRDKPYPLFEKGNIALLEERKQLADPNASSSQPFKRYHPWQYVCIHPFDKSPPRKGHYIYYTFLYVVNGICHLEKTLTSLPLSTKRKLKNYIKAFGPMQEYFKQADGDYSDARICTHRMVCEALGTETSCYFASYPRPKKLCFLVSDYEFLELETIVLGRAQPNSELLRLYSAGDGCEPPHSAALLQEGYEYEQLFPAIRRAQLGAYQAASDLFAKLHFDLRESAQLQWPSNTISAFAPVVGSDDEVDGTELNRRAALSGYAEEMIKQMNRTFRELLMMLDNENRQYAALVENLELAVREFGEAATWVKDMLAFHGNAGRLLELLGIHSFDYLLPAGFHTDAVGIGTQPWQQNSYLLTALVRVCMLDRLRALERPSQQRQRYLLLLMRNSHCDLVSACLERGPSVKVRDDEWLATHSVLPTTVTPWADMQDYKPVMSMLAANWPTPTRERHEGQLPNLANSMLYVNFFGEFEGKYYFFLQEIFKHRNNLRLCGHAKFQTIFSKDALIYSLRKLNKLKQPGKLKFHGAPKLQKRSDAIITMRNLMLLLLELSLKGLYEHCDKVPNFRCTMELNSLFTNGDHPTVKELLDKLFGTVEQIAENERLKFEKLINDILMEFMATQLRYNAAVHDVVRKAYRFELTSRSLVNMDLLRIVLDRRHTLHVVDVFGLQQRLSIKASQKVANRRPFGNIEAMCRVIQESDERRYDSVYKNAARLTVEYQITAEQQWMVECFVQHLDPLGNLYAEELAYIGLTESTIRDLARIDKLQEGCDFVIEDSISIFNNMDIYQSSIVAYFFEYLWRYVRFRPITITNTAFLERQNRTLRKVAAPETEIPSALYTGVASICCDRWNGFFPTKQYFWKIEEEGKPGKIYNSTVGNQSLRKDPVSGEILCGAQQNKPGKKKHPGYFRKLQRNLEIEAGLIPTDIEKEFTTVRSQYLEAQRKSNPNDIPRLAKQRRLENRVPDCARTRVLEFNLNGIALQCPPMKLIKQKKKEAQKKTVDEKKSQDRERLYPPSKSSILPVSHPPYLISPCCCRIHGYRLAHYGANGYFCSGCLPYSNNEKAIANELLCAICLSVVPNRPAFNQCTDDNCVGRRAKKRNKCKNGAQPVLLFDDMYTGRMAYQFFCDDCMLPFRAVPQELLRMSAIKSQSPAIANKILTEQ